MLRLEKDALSRLRVMGVDINLHNRTPEDWPALVRLGFIGPAGVDHVASISLAMGNHGLYAPVVLNPRPCSREMAWVMKDAFERGVDETLNPMVIDTPCSDDRWHDFREAVLDIVAEMYARLAAVVYDLRAAWPTQLLLMAANLPMRHLAVADIGVGTRGVRLRQTLNARPC